MHDFLPPSPRCGLPQPIPLACIVSVESSHRLNSLQAPRKAPARAGFTASAPYRLYLPVTALRCVWGLPGARQGGRRAWVRCDGVAARR